jgi:hypothetical protein
MAQDIGNKVLLLSPFILSNFNEIMYVSFSCAFIFKLLLFIFLDLYTHNQNSFFFQEI